MKRWFEERNAPVSGTLLCQVSDVPNGDVVEFTFGEQKKTMFRMFVYNDDGQLRGYMNVCPHFNVPLNMRPRELFTSDRAQFMCAVHYAKFNLHEGHCTDGPCEGGALEIIPLEIEQGKVFVGRPV